MPSGTRPLHSYRAVKSLADHTVDDVTTRCYNSLLQNLLEQRYNRALVAKH